MAKINITAEFFNEAQNIEEKIVELVISNLEEVVKKQIIVALNKSLPAIIDEKAKEIIQAETETIMKTGFPKYNEYGHYQNTITIKDYIIEFLSKRDYGETKADKIVKETANNVINKELKDEIAIIKQRINQLVNKDIDQTIYNTIKSRLGINQ